MAQTGTSPLKHADVVPSAHPTESPRAEQRPKRRSLGISVLSIIAVLFLLKYARDVFIPLVLAGLLFYALNPIVGWLYKLKVPRVIGSAVVLLTLLGGIAWAAYSVRDEALNVVENLPKAARNLRSAIRPGQ